jgi:hypothetical protein
MTKQEKSIKKRQLMELLQVYSQNANDKGFNYNYKKIAKALNMSARSVRRYIAELRNESILEKTGNYETGKHTIRIKFLVQPPEITKETIILTENIKIDNNKKETIVENPTYKSLLDTINDLVNKNNTWSPITLINTCRYVNWKTGKERITSHTDFKGRVYSSLSYSKSMKEGKIYKNNDFRLDRYTMLKKYGLEDYQEIYDICSEIPRLTAVFNGIHNFGEIEDYYTFLIEKAGIEIDRAAAKTIFMRCYFEKSVKVAWNNFEWSNDFKKLNIGKNDFFAFFETVKKELKPLGNFIFILTSYIEQAVLNEFKDFKLVNVYDGFYSNVRLGGKIKKYLNENCKILLSKVVGFKDKNENLILDHNVIDHNLIDHNLIDQDQDISFISHKSPIIRPEFNKDTLVQGGQNLKDTLVQGGQNLKDIEDGGIFGDNFKDSNTQGESSIQHLNKIIAYNEQKFDMSSGISYFHYRELSEKERPLYIPLRGRFGIVYVKKAA